MKYATLLVFTVLFFLSSAVAQENQRPDDGNDLLPRCQAVIDSQLTDYQGFPAGYCLGLVHGIAFASPKVCPASNVKNVQMVRVVVKFLEDNPEQLNAYESVLVERALSKAFPCRK